MTQGTVSGGLLPNASSLPTFAVNDVSLTSLDNFVQNLLGTSVTNLKKFFHDAHIDDLLNFLETPIPVVSPAIQALGAPPLTPLEVAEGAGLVSPDSIPFINFVDTILYHPLPAEIANLGNYDLGSLTIPPNIDVRNTSLQTDLTGLNSNFDTGDLLAHVEGVENQLLGLLETYLPNFSGTAALNVPLLDPFHGLTVALKAFGGLSGNLANGTNQVLLTFTSPVFSIGPSQLQIPGLSDPGIPIYPPFILLQLHRRLRRFPGAVSFGHRLPGFQWSKCRRGEASSSIRLVARPRVSDLNWRHQSRQPSIWHRSCIGRRRRKFPCRCSLASQ